MSEVIPLYYWSVCKNTLAHIRMAKHSEEGWKRYFKRCNEPQGKEVLRKIFLNKRILNFSKKEYPLELRKLQKELKV